METFLGGGQDPHVIAIQETLYRIGANSHLINLDPGGEAAAGLCLGAEGASMSGIIIWAKRLESHGIHVVYGFADLKTHAKLCLVVRQEGDGIQRYVHTSTGNYNPETAKVYEDVGYFTADQEIVSDVSDMFNYLTGYSNQKEFRALLVAPVQLRTRLCELVTREADHARAGRPARIIIKVNASQTTDDPRPYAHHSRVASLIVRGSAPATDPGVTRHIRVPLDFGRSRASRSLVPQRRTKRDGHRRAD